MKNLKTLKPVLAGAVALVALAGCTISGSTGGTGTTPIAKGTALTGAGTATTSTKVTTASTGTAAPAKTTGTATTAAPAAAPAPATTTAPAAAPASTGFGASNTVFYPTGQEANAALRVDRVCPSEVVAGGNFTYELRVTNVTRVALENVMVTETIPSNFTLVSSDPTGNAANGAASFNLGSLAPGATKTVKVTGKAGNAGSISSCATVSYTLPICCTINVVAPSLKIEKMMLGSAQGGTLESICDIIPVRIVVSNPGTGTARNVMVSDTLPDGLMADGKQAVEFSAGDLAAGQSKTFEFNTKASRTGSFTNNATAKADAGLTAESNKVTVGVKNCNLVISKKADKAQLFLGRNATFTIEVRNTGDGIARNTVVEDTLPAGASFVSASDNGRVAGSNVTWTMGDMAPGASKTLTVVVNPGSNSTVNNVATIKSTCCAAATANASVSYEGVPAIVVELFDSPDALLVGDETTYTVKIRNQGNKTDTNLKSVFVLANGLTFVSGTGSSPVTAAGNTITLGTIASLAPQQEVIWTIRAKCTAPNGDTRQNLSTTTDYFKNPIVEIESTNLVQ